MKRTEEEFEYIGKYLSQRLNATEKADFEALIATDEQWADDVAQVRLLKQIGERQQLRDQIKKIQAEKLVAWQSATDQSTTKVIPMPVRRFNVWRAVGFSVAASVALLIGFLSLTDVSYAPVSSATERSNSIAIQDPALLRLEEGIALLQKKQPQQAIYAFDAIEAIEDIRPYYKDVATWYEVVALTKLGQKAEAKTLLSQIETNPSFQYAIPRLDLWKVKWRLLF
jgi:hypothetical protein